MIPPITAITQGISSRLRVRFWKVTSAPQAVSTVSHRSSDPGWLAHNEVIVYTSGNPRLVCSTTCTNEKSWVIRPYSSAATATSAHPSAAISALPALRASRRS